MRLREALDQVPDHRKSQGRASWTLKLLADRLVECEIVESIHPETVRKTLKKTNSSLG